MNLKETKNAKWIMVKKKVRKLSSDNNIEVK